MSKNPQVLSLKSLYLAAYLLTRKHRLIRFDLVDPDNGYFVFRQDDSIESDVTKYHNSADRSLVPVREYLLHFRHLRDLVMQTKRDARNSGKFPIGGER